MFSRKQHRTTTVLLVCVMIVLFSGVARGQRQERVPNPDSTDRYPFVEYLDQDGDYILKWDFDDVEIRFEIQVRTTGYVAFGISQNGLMVPADVVVGYIQPNGRPTLKDFHTVGYRSPEEDASQDWELDTGREVNGWTVMRFRRRLDTCDPEDDRVITKSTLQLIYAFDAVKPNNLNALFHHDKRGTKAINLLGMTKVPKELPPNSQILEFLNQNYTIPSDQPNSYFCRVFNLSYLTQKYHAVKISPVFHAPTKLHVYHMILYRCKVDNSPVSVQTGEGSSCFTDAPNHVQFCREYVAGFANGGKDLYFPEDVGLPVGGVNEADIYVLAIHYDNSDYIPGLVDNSGIQVIISPQLRRHEGAFLMIGNVVSQNWLQFIPPEERNFVQKAYCSQRCLSWGFIGSGSALPMTVTGVQFHAHELAKRMRLRHLTYIGRNRVRENPWIAEDKTFDKDAQEFRILKRRNKIGYWDQLLLECTYDSSKRTQPTVGGWTGYDELCRAYLFYYPRKTIEGCLSWSNYDQLRDSSGRRVSGDQVFPTLVATDWSNPQGMRRNLKRALDNSIELTQCWSSKLRVPYGIDYFRQPRITQPFMEATQSVCPSPRSADVRRASVQMFG